MRSFLFKHDVLHTKISAAGTIQSSLAFFLIDHCGKISTLKEHFVEEEKFNHDLPAPSIPLLCSLSHADWTERSDRWCKKKKKKKQRVSWLPFQTQLTPILCVCVTATTLFRSVPRLRAHAWTNGFVYILTSSMLWSDGSLRTAGITCSQCLSFICSGFLMSLPD